MKILDCIISFLKSTTRKSLQLLFETIKNVTEYLILYKKEKIKEKEQKEQKEFEVKVDQVIDHGTIEDLLDLKRN